MGKYVRYAKGIIKLNPVSKNQPVLIPDDPTIDVLPEIVEAVAGRAQIIIDGGWGCNASIYDSQWLAQHITQTPVDVLLGPTARANPEACQSGRRKLRRERPMRSEIRDRWFSSVRACRFANSTSDWSEATVRMPR